MATQYSNKPIVTDGLVYALDFGNPKSYVSGSATAQSLIYRPTPARFETLLPGDYGTPAAAYSVRKVVSSYTGSAMQIQSASATLDIGFDADGNLNTASIASFAGSGDAFVKIWYDQSGNNRHASQTTTADQPKIYSGSQGSVILENNKPAVQFDGSNDFLSYTFSTNLSQPGTYFVVNKNTADPGIISSDNDNSRWQIYRTSAGTKPINMFSGTVLSSNDVTYNQVLIYSLFNGSNSEISINNNTATTGDAGTQQNSAIRLGRGSTSGFGANKMQEVILYNSDQSSNRFFIQNNINNYYQIYTSSYNPTPTPDNDFLDFTDESVLQTQQSFPGFSYDQGNSTIMYVGETKGDSTVFTQDGTLSIISTTSSVGFGSPSNNFGRSYPVTGLKHVTLRFSSGSVDCFINGVPVSASAIFPTGSSIGGGQLNIPLYTGSLGGFQVYNRPLTGDEIYNNYLVSARRYSLPDNPKPYTLDENAYLFLQSAGITDPIITSSIDTFVRGLKSNNLWDKMIAIYPFVGTGSDGTNLTGSHRWNLKEPSLVTYPLTFTGSWQGSTSGSAPSGSGTNISVNGITPSQYYPFFSTQSAHISILSYDTPVSSSYLMGTGMTEDLAVSTLAGDYGTPAAAYSVRKVRTAYSGALMDVRRSLDNVTASIGYVETGDLDTGSLLDWVIPGRNDLPGEYEGLAAAYSLRKVSSSYDGPAIKVRGEVENQVREIGFTDSGVLDTGSLLNFAATGSNTLAGDYSGLAAAYSLRKVVSGYAGDLIEVQSGSVSQSIGFDSLGNLDTGSLLTFAGSGNVFVKTWYDQSGNNNHATQSDANLQPKIVSAGSIISNNGTPGIQFASNNTDNNVRLLNNTITGNQPFTIFATANRLTLDGRQSLVDGPSPYWRMGISLDNSNVLLQAGQNLTYGTVFTGSQVHYALFSGSTSQASINGGPITTGDAGTNSLTGNTFRIGGLTADYTWIGTIEEIILYSSSQASNRTYIENNINAYYDIYTTSSTSTENAYVSTWYDQSGNNRHATQTTAARQPLIVSSGSLVTSSAKPALRFNGTSTNLKTNTFSAVSQPFTTFTHVKYQNLVSFNFTITHGNEIGVIGAINSGGGHLLRAGASLYEGTLAASNTPYLYYALFSGSNSQIAINGNTATTGNAGTNQFAQITIGSDTDDEVNTFIDGFVSEHLEYYSDQSANKALIENNINNYYNIYTGSNHGFVARWYDQSGNNRHATQTATGSQPIIVRSGSLITTNNKPAPTWISSSLTSSLQGISRLDMYVVQQASSTAYLYPHSSNLVGSYGMVVLSGSTSNNLSGYAATPTFFVNGGEFLGTTRGQLFTAISSSQRIVVQQNTSTTGWGNFYIAAFPGLEYSGSFQEMIFYSGNQSLNREAIEYGINDYYNIYPQTSSFTTSSFTIKADPTSISGSINNKLTSGIASSGPLGLITVSRTGSDSLTLARNGAVTSFNTPASGALSSGIYLGAINNNGLALGNSPLNLSFASVGTGLTGAETVNLSRLVYQANYYRDPSIITNGLTLNLDSQNPTSYPGSGNTWFDLSENNYNATLLNGFSYSNNNGGVIVFNGVNNTGGRGVFTNYYPVFSSDFTINLWVNFSTYKQYQNIISSANDGNATQGFWLEFGSVRGFTMYSNSSNLLNDNLVSLTTLTTNTWHNVCVSRVGTGSNNLKLYVDNVLCGQSTRNVAIGNINQNLEIARYAKNATNLFFQGSIARIQIYNSRGFTSDEVSQNFNATRGRFGI